MWGMGPDPSPPPWDPPQQACIGCVASGKFLSFSVPGPPRVLQRSSCLSPPCLGGNERMNEVMSVVCGIPRRKTLQKLTDVGCPGRTPSSWRTQPLVGDTLMLFALGDEPQHP